MKVSISDLLEHWYGLVESEKKILSLARVSYIVTWRKTFKTSRSKGLSDVLLLIRLLFTVPFSKAKLERMFSRLKRVKPISVAPTLMFGKYFENYGRG